MNSITETEYNRLLKEKFHKGGPVVGGLMEQAENLREEIRTEERRISGYKGKIQETRGKVANLRLHREVIIESLHLEGVSGAEIARRTGVSRARISQIILALDTSRD